MPEIGGGRFLEFPVVTSGTNREEPPPSPDGVPLLGNGLAFSRAPFEALSDWADEGDVVRLSFPGRSTYLVTDPDLVQRILVEDQGALIIGREQRQTFTGVEDDAVTANTGDRWKRLRSALHPAFTREGIKRYGRPMDERTADHVDRLRSLTESQSGGDPRLPSC